MSQKFAVMIAYDDDQTSKGIHLTFKRRMSLLKGGSRLLKRHTTPQVKNQSSPADVVEKEKSDFMFVLYRTVMPLFSSKPLTRALSMILPVYSSPLMPGIPA